MEILLVVLLEIGFGGVMYVALTKLFSIKDRKNNKPVGPTQKKTKAYIEGYKDMLRGGLNYYITIEEDSDDDPLGSAYYSSYWDRTPTTTLYFDSKRTPFFQDSLMLKLAEEVMEGKRSVNIEKGQYDDTYVGGSDVDFADYYAGGMKFLEDLDSAKQKVLDKRLEEENRKRLIINRRAGLKEINRKVEFDMQALGELRAQAFKPELTMKEEWEKEWKS